MRSRTAGVITTVMRNGRDRRSGKPVLCHARKERVLLVGTRSADHIRASSRSGCIQSPNTWLHPNASLNCQIHLAMRAPSIHGKNAKYRRTLQLGSWIMSGFLSEVVCWINNPACVRSGPEPHNAAHRFAATSGAVSVATSRLVSGHSRRASGGFFAL